MSDAVIRPRDTMIGKTSLYQSTFLVMLQTGKSIPVAQKVKHLPTMRETWVQFLGWADLLEKEMATDSSILAWKIPWTEETVRLQSMGSQIVRHD